MKKKILPWILVIFWLALIFSFSHQPATESNELSLGITRRIADLIKSIVPDTWFSQDKINFIIRKGAHFGVYLVLGLLVYMGLLYSNISKHKLIFLALLICILYAISDEVHQLFVIGRSGQISDVLLDSSGSLVGILVINAISRVKTKLFSFS